MNQTSVRKSRSSAAQRHPIGAHMSIAGGVFNALVDGAAVGCTAIQVFTKSNQQWKARPLKAEEVERFFELRKETGIVPACAHASYLINLASPDRALHAKSVTALVEELRRCDTLELPELVIHPGAHMGKGVEWGVKRVAAAVNRGHDRLPDGRCRVCLETTAGAGTTLGSAFEELAAIVALVEDQRRVSICVDTCHIFAAGYDIGDTKSYRRTIKNLADTLGLRRVAIFHMNDSRADCGERKDRHQHIGRGKIGLEGFRLIMNDRRFANIPKILETPKGPNMAMDVDNIAVLRALIGVKTP